MRSKCLLSLALLITVYPVQRLHAQSSFVDPSFNPGTGATDGLVETVIPQPDGKVLICGNFLTVNSVARSFVARLNNDGSVDTSFEAHPGYWVRHMALQPDGKIVIGGFFTNVEGVPRNRIARLNPDGSLDKTFDPGLGAETKIVPADDKDPFVFWMLVQPDGKIVITGNFLTYNGTPSSGLALINSDGSLDTTFHVGSGYDSWGRFLLLLPNKQLIATGWFTSYNGQSYNRMVRVNPDGSADPAFKPFFGDKTAIYGAVALPDNKLIVVGHSINDQNLFMQKIARLNTDGSVDSNYVASASDKVESICLQADGKAVIGGYFSIVDGQSRNGLARLNPDGTLDETFKAETDNFVWTVHPQFDGKILVSGGFGNIDGISRGGVARLLTTGGSIVTGTGSGGGTGTGTGGGTGTGSGDGGGSGGTGGNGGGSGLTAPSLLHPAWKQGNFSVEVPTVSGHSYELQYQAPGSTHWLSLPAIDGDGTTQKFVDPNASSSQSRLYRILIN